MIDIAEIKAKRVKTTILSGFLGAGKTSLVNHIIRHNQDRKIAVLVNDFGEINIDSDLILSRDENKIDLTGGCVCCTIQKDLIASVINLMKQADRPNHILVECSGAAEPSQVLHTLSSPLLKFHLHVDGLFTVIDCSQVRQVDTKYRGLVGSQIKAANLLILNKTDLLDSRELAQVKEFVREISPTAVMLESIRCQVPIDLVLGFNEIPKLIETKDSGDTRGLQSDNQGTIVGILPAVPTHEAASHDLMFESWSFTSKTPFQKRHSGNCWRPFRRKLSGPKALHIGTTRSILWCCLIWWGNGLISMCTLKKKTPPRTQDWSLLESPAGKTEVAFKAN